MEDIDEQMPDASDAKAVVKRAAESLDLATWQHKEVREKKQKSEDDGNTVDMQEISISRRVTIMTRLSCRCTWTGSIWISVLPIPKVTIRISCE